MRPSFLNIGLSLSRFFVIVVDSCFVIHMQNRTLGLEVSAHSCGFHNNTGTPVSSSNPCHLLPYHLYCGLYLRFSTHQGYPLLSVWSHLHISLSREKTKLLTVETFQGHSGSHMCWLYVLTGRQNSSNAGFTNVMYCMRTLSRSRPRSLMSRSTGKKDRKKKTLYCNMLTSNICLYNRAGFEKVNIEKCFSLTLILPCIDVNEKSCPAILVLFQVYANH